MIEEGIEKIAEIVRNERPDDTLAVNDGTGRIYLRNETLKRYDPVSRFPTLNLMVSTLDSFADMIFHGAPGDNPIVVVNKAGGTYLPFGGLPDKNGRVYELSYSRSYTVAWNAFRQALGKMMEQSDFIRLLQGLRPYFATGEYTPVVSSFKKVTFDERTLVKSNPHLENGKAGRSIVVEVTLKGGDDEVALPGGFTLNLPVVKGSVKTIEVEIEAKLNGSKIFFLLFAADKERIEEEIREAEIDTLQSLAAGLEEGKRPLILRND